MVTSQTSAPHEWGDPGPRHLVGGGGRAHGIFRDLGAGRVDACKVLDVTVTVHLKSHDGLLHGLLVTAGRGEEILWKQEKQITNEISFVGL